ncbi:hypothetical protein KORDIASMS9_04058 [Kordia sp. SMS9]|uniref:hypothetical protein n=1 Tax=Kordia sp. SMS9 TaxID=2282170 RepID=UPI000E0D9456|nr:hypothetical protein [Kordia sp. SMS9]AXG71800.1 hypothetical protein KORDIASMS9_04058 [Kordia sp. SMS9]
MKLTFLRQVFQVRVIVCASMLLGVTFLLYACSDDNLENRDNDASESIEIETEGSLKLMVDGQFDKNIADMNEIENGVYKYVIKDSEEDVVYAYTDDNAFKQFDNYDVFKSKMPELNRTSFKSLPNYDESEILVNIESNRRNAISNTPTKASTSNDIAHIANYDWPLHENTLVAHFDFTNSWYDTHYVVELSQNLPQANSTLTHYHYTDMDNVFNSTWNGYIRYGFANADHTIVKSTRNTVFNLLLFSGNDYTGTYYWYTIQPYSGIEVPNNNYGSIYLF